MEGALAVPFAECGTTHAELTAEFGSGKPSRVLQALLVASKVLNLADPTYGVAIEARASACRHLA